jgi:uncharacterized membrane protein (UPF0127 family)
VPGQSIAVGEQELLVAIADEPAERGSGLMEVEDLGALDGMLFVYDVEAQATFFMLNTLIPLDVWWFDGDGILIGTAGMDPCPFEPCVSYGSPGPVRWVLETPLGDFDFEMGSLLSNVERG